MRLSRIEIENFKGIGKRQAIDLKPITLLFGPNSAGKSTILQALHYVREILERQNPDPDLTIAGGLIDLGGFKALVHNHELDRAITIKLVIDLSAEQGSERLPLNAGGSLDDPEFENLNVRYLLGEYAFPDDRTVVQEVGVEIEVRWSDLLAGAYVSTLTVEMNGALIASAKSPPQVGRAILTDFNFANPLLQQIPYQDDTLTEEELKEMYAQGVDELTDDMLDDPLASPLGSEIWEVSRDMALENTTFKGHDFRVAIATKTSALPDPNKLLASDLRDPDPTKFEQEHSTPRVRGLAALLDELLLGPVRIVSDYLGAMTYIGPLREVPARSFRPRLSPDESRWAQGLAAWDLLYSDVKGELIEAVNHWIGDEIRLNTGYRLEKAAFCKIQIQGPMSLLFTRGLTEDDLGELQDLYENLETHVEIALRDFEKGILVTPGDVGVGISQMIPVVVGCLTDGTGLLAVEQPELHTHPAIQVGLGDLLIHAVGGNQPAFSSSKSLLVETHSEHIMLRLLRRVRETSEGELPPGAPSLTPEALSIIYVESDADGVTFRALRVDNEGDFIDRWPRGFFDERAEELF